MAALNLAWERTKRSLRLGDFIRGFVRRHEPSGVFVEIPGISFPGLVQVADFKDQGKMTVAEYPPLGTEIEARILGFKDVGRQIRLGMRPSQLTQNCQALRHLHETD